MDIVAQRPEKINLPADHDAYRAFVAALDMPTRLLLFGVPPRAVTFRCPTNGRIYADEGAELVDACIWSHCYWCDANGHVRGQDRDFDRASPAWHANPIVE